MERQHASVSESDTVYASHMLFLNFPLAQTPLRLLASAVCVFSNWHQVEISAGKEREREGEHSSNFKTSIISAEITVKTMPASECKRAVLPSNSLSLPLFFSVSNPVRNDGRLSVEWWWVPRVQPRCASVLMIRVESAVAIPNAKVVLTYSHTHRHKYVGILALKKSSTCCKRVTGGTC